MPRRPDLPPLSRAQLREDPMEQFAAWFERALMEAPLAEAMTLATVDESGQPDARMVLLKGFGPAGFRFFSNYASAKGAQLEASPEAAIVVYWRELDRQVRARGAVERISAEDSDAYFATRADDAKVGAWASPQSRPIHSRGELDGLVDDVESRFAGQTIARPPHWGGYVLRPETVEFWQGQAARLHDRFRYTRTDAGWTIDRLAP
jgi:pyridoxamine 5'-phosphate oxidase